MRCIIATPISIREVSLKNIGSLSGVGKLDSETLELVNVGGIKRIPPPLPEEDDGDTMMMMLVPRRRLRRFSFYHNAYYLPLYADARTMEWMQRLDFIDVHASVYLICATA